MSYIARESESRLAKPSINESIYPVVEWTRIQNLFSQHFRQAKSHWSPRAPGLDPTHCRCTVTYHQPDTHRSAVFRAAQVFTTVTLFVCCVRRSWQVLPYQSLLKFQQLLQEYDRVFDPQITGYNGAAGPIQATVNIGPVQPPQRKGRIPQYSRNQLVELQAMFDELTWRGQGLPSPRRSWHNCWVP